MKSRENSVSPDTSKPRTDALTGPISDVATCTCEMVKGPFGEPLIRVCQSCEEMMWNGQVTRWS
jgi:hypothetical protein